MKYLVTIVHMSRATRRRMGKSRTEIVEVPDHSAPDTVEKVVEERWDREHEGSHSFIKVVDVRPVEVVEVRG